MTPEALRIAIAQDQGWEQIGITSKSNTLVGMLAPMRAFMEIPDYPGDLNVMHEVVSAAAAKDGWLFQELYISTLHTVTRRRRPDVNEGQAQFWTAEAEARQRAEAYARVKGIWTNDTP